MGLHLWCIVIHLLYEWIFIELLRRQLLGFVFVKSRVSCRATLVVDVVDKSPIPGPFCLDTSTHRLDNPVTRHHFFSFVTTCLLHWHSFRTTFTCALLPLFYRPSLRSRLEIQSQNWLRATKDTCTTYSHVIQYTLKAHEISRVILKEAPVKQIPAAAPTLYPPFGPRNTCYGTISSTNPLWCRYRTARCLE